MVHAAQGVGDVKGINPRYADNVSRLGLTDLQPLQSVIAHDLQDFAVTAVTVAVDDGHRGVGFHRAPGNTADSDDTHVTAVIQGRNL